MGTGYRGDYPSGYPAGQPRRDGEGLATASLVLGIASFIVLGIILAIPAVILGNKSLQRGDHGKARAGRILGWINIAISVLALVLWITLTA